MNEIPTKNSNELECEDILIPISETEIIRPYDKFYDLTCEKPVQDNWIGISINEITDWPFEALNKVYRSVRYLNHDNENVSKCSWKAYTEN